MVAERTSGVATRLRERARSVSDRALGANLAWSVTLATVVLLLLAAQRCADTPLRLTVGDRPRSDVRARFDFEVPDETRTLEERRRAEAAVPEVWVHDLTREERVAGGLASTFEDGRRALAAGADAAATLPDRVRRAAAPALFRQRFARDIESVLTDAVRNVMSGLVVANREVLEDQPEILVVEQPGAREYTLADWSRVLDLDEARERVRDSVRRSLELADADETALGGLAASFVDGNLVFDVIATRERRATAFAAVASVGVRVERGSVLARAGQPIDEHTRALLEAEALAARGRMDAVEFSGYALIAGALAFFMWRYTVWHQRNFKRVAYLHALLVVVTLTMLLLGEWIAWIAGHVVDGMAAPFGVRESYLFLVPIGAGAVLIGLLTNGRIANVYSTFVAVLYGAIHGWSLSVALWAWLTQLAAVYAITTYRDRAALLRAGLVTGAAGAVFCLALHAVREGLAPDASAAYAAVLAFVGGAVGTGLVVSFLLPLFEGLFNVLTEIRLLELSNIDSPLLSQLAVKAPGSYNHSLVVGSLAEEAAKAIGANALFCRVAAFYHDIGKITKPEYFVENQGPANPHDKLTPSMSALVIASHVKDGMRIAREAGLPEQIVDIIPQHHGTRLMTFFFEKAKASADPALGAVSEDEFRYPGPKPQTREAAIFMLADAVEAAARTVDDPTPPRLREVIRRVTNVIVLDAQLDECDLTFLDLDRIQHAFLRSLVGMHHHRVEYPGFEFNRRGRASGVVKR